MQKSSSLNTDAGIIGKYTAKGLGIAAQNVGGVTTGVLVADTMKSGYTIIQGDLKKDLDFFSTLAIAGAGYRKVKDRY